MENSIVYSHRYWNNETPMIVMVIRLPSGKLVQLHGEISTLDNRFLKKIRRRQWVKNEIALNAAHEWNPIDPKWVQNRECNAQNAGKNSLLRDVIKLSRKHNFF